MPDPDISAEFLSQVGDFRQILDALQRLPGALFAIKNLESRYIYMSSALRRVIQVDASSDVVGRTDFDLFPKIIAESFRQNDQSVFQHGKPLLDEVHLTCFYNRAPGWSFSIKSPIHDKHGRIIGLVIVNELYEKVMGEQAELVKLLPAIDHVSKHFGQRITIEELAALCGVSASHFMRIFRVRLKMTAYSFVEQVRLHHAMESLKKGTTGITQIAIDCGFYDHSAFVKRFKKFTGTTPLNYRRQHQAAFANERPIVLPTPSK
jgi:AraC-like DNA-binding protein